MKTTTEKRLAKLEAAAAGSDVDTRTKEQRDAEYLAWEAPHRAALIALWRCGGDVDAYILGLFGAGDSQATPDAPCLSREQRFALMRDLAEDVLWEEAGPAGEIYKPGPSLYP